MVKRSILSLILLCMMLEPAISQLGTTHRSASRKGWSVGVEGSYGVSMIKNSILSSYTFENGSYTWESIPGNGINIGLNGYYFFNNFFGIRSGVAYNTYESSFLLNGTYTESVLSVDVNEDHYYLVKTADYNSDLKLSYISLPLVANITLGKPGRNGLFVEGGAVLEQKFAASYQTTGIYNTCGYYPYHPAVTQALCIGELGFGEESIERTRDIRTSFVNITGYMAFGLNLAFGKLSTVRIGAELLYGIRDIDMGIDYEKFYGNSDYQSSILTKYSIKLSYILKL